MGWTKKKERALYKGKGYEPGHKTKDKDLIIPEVESEDPYWPELGPKADLCEIYGEHEEPRRYAIYGGYRAARNKLKDWEITPAPEGWSPRQ